MADPDVQAALLTCGASNAEIMNLCITQRLNSLADDYALMSQSELSSMFDRLEKRSVQNGRLILPEKVITNIHALCYWCRERTKLEQPLNGAAFDGAALRKARLDMQERNEQSISAKTDTTPSVKMDKLDPTKWNNWSRHFRTYLSNIQGEQNASLDYVIRTEPAAIPLATMDPRERGLYDYPLTGDTFRKDNQKTYRLLVELVRGTAGWTWIQAHDRAQNGRAAWLALYDHYEGGNQRKKRTVQATNTLEKLYYSNESAFPFEKFAAELIQCFDDLKDTEEEPTEYKKVTHLLGQLLSNVLGTAESVDANALLAGLDGSSGGGSISNEHGDIDQKGFR